MLALMYAGELCYWAWELKCGPQSHEEGEAGQEEKAMVERRGEVEEGKGEGKPSLRKRQENGCADKDRVAKVTPHRSEPPPPPPPLFSSLLSQLKGAGYVQQYCMCFSPTDTGRSFLERYIMLAQGPLKSHNWNYARAVELLELLKT